MKKMQKSLAMLAIAIMLAVTFSGFVSATDDTGDNSVDEFASDDLNNEFSDNNPCPDGINEDPDNECDLQDEKTNEELKYNPPCPPCTAAIGDRVWNDSNANGIQDLGEQGIANVTVNLWTGNETDPITKNATTKTDENGNYYFKNLIKSIYWLEFIAPAATDGTWIFSPQDQGTDNWIDSDPNASGIAGPINVNECKYCPTWDAGLVFVAAAGGDEDGAAGGEEEIIEIVTFEEVAAAGETIPLQETGVPILPGVLAALVIGGGLLERKLRK